MNTEIDAWLQDDGPAALTIREHLMPVEGPDGVLFPATFAASEDKTFKGGYNIDCFPDGTNICLIDSVGSQANRIEPIFEKGDYAALVPQIVIDAGRKINLLEAGHRAGDAIVRCSSLQEELRQAFQAAGKGDHEALARIAPTSLVFGAWDSRDTQTKLPRLIVSTIRAYNVKELKRSAQYVPATEYVAEGLLEDPGGDKKLQDEYAKRGFRARAGFRGSGRRHRHWRRAARCVSTPGRAANDLRGTDERTPILRRYILGLALTAFTYSGSGYLRQGCNLVLDAEKGRVFQAVYNDGRRVDVAVPHGEAMAYAKAAAAEFVVGPSREVPFDKERAKADLSGDGSKKAGKGKAAKAK